MLSISAQVKAANTKLAKFLLSKEEEEGFLNYKRPKKKSLDEAKKEVVGRWQLAVDFRIPSRPVQERPSTPDGRTTFHCSLHSVSKVVVPRYPDGAPIAWASPAKHTTPAENAAYIEDHPLGAEAASTHAIYVEDGSVPVASTERVSGSMPSRVRAIYSNISDDPRLRDLYWRQVPGVESEVRSCNLSFAFNQSLDWWRSLPNATDIDQSFRAFALGQAERYHLAIGRWKSFNCSLEDGNRILRQIEALPGFDPAQRPVRYETRGGRTQTRMVIELPHELGLEPHQKIMVAIGDYLDRLECTVGPDGREAPGGMMFTAVIHAPDHGNDERNFHLHIVAHDRRAVLVEGPQGPAWEFARKKVQKTRARNFPKTVRNAVEKIVNRELAAAGIKRRYDARDYLQMGIPRTPAEHLGNEAQVIDAAGPFTPVGARNGINAWRDLRKEAKAEAKRIRQALDTAEGTLGKLIESIHTLDPNRSDCVALQRLLPARRRLVEELSGLCEESLLLALKERQAKSRAQRVKLSCEAVLIDIQEGRAASYDQRNERHIRERLRSAVDVIAEVDLAISEHRAAIAAAPKAMDHLRAKLDDFDVAFSTYAKRIKEAARGLHEELPLPAELAGYLEQPAISSHSAGAAKNNIEGARQSEVDANLPMRTGEVAVPPLNAVEVVSSSPALPASATDVSELTDGQQAEAESVQKVAEKTVGNRRAESIGSAPRATEAGRLAPPVLAPETTLAVPGDVVAATPASATTRPLIPGGVEREDRSVKDAPFGLAARRQDGPSASRQVEPAPAADAAGAEQEVELRGYPQPGVETPSLGSETEPASPSGAEVGEVRSSPSIVPDEGALTIQATPSPAPPGSPVFGRGKEGDKPARAFKQALREDVQTPGETRPANPCSDEVAASASEAVAAPSTAPQASPRDAPVGTDDRRLARAVSAETQAWNEAFAALKSSPSIILKEDEVYRVESLPPEHARELVSFRNSKRTQGRLRTHFARQEQEVGRFLAWMDKNGNDDKVLVFKLGKDGQDLAVPGPDMPMAMRTVLKRYFQHPRVRQIFKDELERRQSEYEAMARFHQARQGRMGGR